MRYSVELLRTGSCLRTAAWYEHDRTAWPDFAINAATALLFKYPSARACRVVDVDKGVTIFTRKQG